MEYRLDTGAHSTDSLHYHNVLVVKNRCEVFNEELSEFFYKVVTGFTDNYGVEIKNLEADGDHVHHPFKATPTTDLDKFINVLKGVSVRRIRNEYRDHFEDKLSGDRFCTDSYCFISTGQVSLDVLKEYVANQRERDNE